MLRFVRLSFHIVCALYVQMKGGSITVREDLVLGCLKSNQQRTFFTRYFVYIFLFQPNHSVFPKPQWFHSPNLTTWLEMKSPKCVIVTHNTIHVYALSFICLDMNIIFLQQVVEMGLEGPPAPSPTTTGPFCTISALGTACML